MSQIPNEAPGVYARYSPPRTWAGALEGAERATHYLHLAAFPCKKCKGPVILGWIGTREDDISKETEIKLEQYVSPAVPDQKRRQILCKAVIFAPSSGSGQSTRNQTQ